MMASDENLIDFSAESPQRTQPPPLPNNFNMPPITVTTPVVGMELAGGSPHATTVPTPIVKTGKQNKSLFEITRVEAHGESVGGDDSELDDTLSEAHESSSTSILESISKYPESNESLKNTEKVDTAETVVSTKPLTVETCSTLTTTVSSSSSSTSSSHTPPVQHPADPPSRFRIVKISKAKPYDKGKWSISEFQDSQKQKDESSDMPASPLIKRTRGTTECSGDHKHDRTKNVTSPTEPRKTTSSESLMQTVLSTSQSRGSSFNTAFADRQSSGESTHVTDAVAIPPIVKPVVSTLENVLDQIQNVKEAMVVAVNEELKTLRENVHTLQIENNNLKEENRKLKERLSIAEGKLGDIR